MPPDRPTIFIDRSSWSNTLHVALSDAGIPHEAHRWHFARHDVSAEALTARDTGRLLVLAYPAITRAVAEVAPPAFFSISMVGEVRRLRAGG